jgi:hypothetical protein
MSEAVEAAPEAAPVEAAPEGNASVKTYGEEAPSTPEQSFEDGGDTYKYAGKYESVEALEQGYKEAVQKMTQKIPQAPEAYELQLNEELAARLPSELTMDDPMLEHMIPVLKNVGVTQEGFNAIVENYLEGELSGLPDPDAEMNALGGEANELLTKAEAFVNKFPEAEADVLMGLSTTADGVRTLAKLQDMMSSQDIPTREVEAVQVDPQDLYSQASQIKNNTPNFEANTDAIKRYEKLMMDAIRLEERKKR